MNARTITQALAGRWHGSYGTARCPVHDDNEPSLSVRDGDDQVLVTCFAGCDRRDVLAELRRRELLDDAPRPDTCRPLPVRATPPAPAERLAGIWRRGLPIAGTVVETYLRARGCAVPMDADLRYLPPSARHPWPVMAALVTDFVTGSPMTLHFTSLLPNGFGKAPIDRPKRLLAGHPKRGGVIRLTPNADVERQLGVAEGIESALAVTAALGQSALWLPVWATIDAGNMGALPIAPGIERLTIFLDADPAGQKGAGNLAATWHHAGREVFIATPPRGDWNETSA